MNRPEQPGDPDQMGLETDKSYANEAVRGSAWTFLQTFVRKGLSILVQLILARLLFPSDFGLVATAIGMAAVVQIVGPGPMIDLLVQRQKRLPNAIHNTWLLAFLTAIVTGIAILFSAWILSERPGQPMRAIGDQTLTSETSLDQINADPSLPVLLEDANGTFELDIDGKWQAMRLPKPTQPDISIADYATLIQANIDETIGAEKVDVTFAQDQDRFRITTTDGQTVPTRSKSAVEGAVLDTLGIGYKSQPLLWLLALLALRPLLWALLLPYAAVLRLKLRFASIAKSNLVANTSSQAIAVGLAFIGGGGLALLIPHLVHPALLAVFFFLIARPLPSVPKKDREKMLPIATDSASLWLAQWVHSATLQVPNLILAYFVSTREVGYFYFAFLLSVQIIAILSYNLSSALTPIFSNLQEQQERLISGFLRSVGAITGVTVPLFIGTAAAAPIFVPLIFGEKWTPAISILMVLLVAQAISSTTPPTASLLKSTGRYRTWLAFQVTQGVVFLTAVVFASWTSGAMGVAWAVLGQQLVFAPIGIYLCIRGRARKREIARIYIIPFIACIPMIPVAFFIYSLDPGFVALLVWCPLLLLSAGVVYVLIIRVLDRARYDEIVSILNSLKGKLFRALRIQ